MRIGAGDLAHWGGEMFADFVGVVGDEAVEAGGGEGFHEFGEGGELWRDGLAAEGVAIDFEARVVGEIDEVGDLGVIGDAAFGKEHFERRADAVGVGGDFFKKTSIQEYQKEYKSPYINPGANTTGGK